MDQHGVQTLLLEACFLNHGNEGLEQVAVANAALIFQVRFPGQVLGQDDLIQAAFRLQSQQEFHTLGIGLTIVAMGTSAPEAAVSITAATTGNAGITIGNVIGSNILNVLLI